MLYYLRYCQYLFSFCLLWPINLAANDANYSNCYEFNINESITIKQAVNITIICNRNIQKAYLSRVNERYNLDVAEYKFKPNMSLNLNTDYSELDNGIDKSIYKNITTGPKFDILTPLGTTISLAWDNIASNSTIKTFENASSITIRQPLLKRFGTDLNTASVKNARDLNTLQLLQLIDIIRNEINKTIFLFRQIIQTQNQLNIQEKILDMSNTLLEQTKILIKTGRLAEYERVQVESQVASQNVNLADARINLKKAYLMLSNQLGVNNSNNITTAINNNNLKINYSENLIIPEPVTTPVATLLPLALLNNINYQNLIVQEKILQRDYYLAYDQSRWTLDLNASYGLHGYDNKYVKSVRNHLQSSEQNKSIGLQFNIPIDSNPVRQQALIENKVRTQQLNLDKKQVEQEILSELQDQLYQQTTLWSKLQLAKKSVEIKINNYTMAKTKYEAGRLSSFELVRIQDDVQNAKVNENASIIAYLNNHTIIDRILNKTFATWGLNVKIE